MPASPADLAALADATAARAQALYHAACGLAADLRELAAARPTPPPGRTPAAPAAPRRAGRSSPAAAKPPVAVATDDVNLQFDMARWNVEARR